MYQIMNQVIYRKILQRTAHVILFLGLTLLFNHMGQGTEIFIQSTELQTAKEAVAVKLLTARLQENGYTIITEKTPTAKNNVIRFSKNPRMNKESYQIQAKEREIVITAGEQRGFIYGAGKCLRGLGPDNGFIYSGATGTFRPGRPLRGVYFATHFGNFYHRAPLQDVCRYIEDMALFGFNTLCVWFDFHHYQGINDPQAQEMTVRLHDMLKYANSIGMEGALTMLANEAYANSPRELRAIPFPHHYKVELCPSTPQGLDKILEYRSEMLDRFADLDFACVCLWPYDQGGCRCEKCAPWGCNGYLRNAEAVAALIRKKMPRTKIVLSTWEFGYWYKDDVEWIGLYKKLAEKPLWLDYVMIEHHGNFPEYVLKNGKPGGLPVINFPEISMNNMTPWGGFGANIQFQRLCNVWNSSKSLLSGGFLYSEGIYEDVNKFLCSQFYWEPDRSGDSILTEYVSAFFSKEKADIIIKAIKLLDANMAHSIDNTMYEKIRGTKNLADAPVVYQLHKAGKNDMAEPLRLLDSIRGQLDKNVLESWRWKMIHNRAVLDAELSKSGGRPTKQSEAAFKIISNISKDQDTKNYKEGVWVKIPRIQD